MRTMANITAAVVRCCALVLLAAPAARAQYQFINQPFTGTTAPGWTFLNAAGDGPLLTAPSLDSAGNGWLRLTADKQFQNSFVYYNEPIPTAFGLDITITFAIWTADRENVADGIAIVLFDNAAVPAAGGWGGSLGYAQHSGFGSIGMNGGFAAFGIDSWGNFSNPTEDRIGGPGFEPYSITLRGSQGATRADGYEYITGNHNVQQFARTNARNRGRERDWFTLNMRMTADRYVTIRMRKGTGAWTTLVDTFLTTLVFPERVKFGFTASTGGETSNQEIRNFTVSTITSPECINDSQCPAGDYCVAYICADCRTDADCGPGYVCNSEYVCEEETLIELGSFDASWQDDGIAVSWVTEAEIDNAYFDLYRAESKKKSKKGFKPNSKKGLKMGPYVKINADPIPAEGIAPFGTSYEYLDTDVEYGRRYWYKLQDVDLYGTATQHGPCGPVSAWEDCSYER